jgi:hypothetical protein
VRDVAGRVRVLRQLQCHVPLDTSKAQAGPQLPLPGAPIVTAADLDSRSPAVSRDTCHAIETAAARGDTAVSGVAGQEYAAAVAIA